jgi:hypothetical protein
MFRPTGSIVCASVDRLECLNGKAWHQKDKVAVFVCGHTRAKGPHAAGKDAARLGVLSPSCHAENGKLIDWCFLGLDFGEQGSIFETALYSRVGFAKRVNLFGSRSARSSHVPAEVYPQANDVRQTF